MRRDLPGRLDPVPAGHRDVHQHDVGPDATRQLDRRIAVGRLAEQLDPRCCIDQRPEAAPDDRVVVGHDHAYRGRHVALRRLKGSTATTVVPPPAWLSSRKLPPSSSARSRIEVRPTPAGAPSASPCPSSVTETSSASPSIASRTWASVPPL